MSRSSVGGVVNVVSRLFFQTEFWGLTLTVFLGLAIWELQTHLRARLRV